MHIVARAKSLEKGIARTRLGRPPGSTGSQIERNKHRLASLVLLGRRNGQIAREFGVSSRTIGTWLKHPEVQEEIKELEAESHRSTERQFTALFSLSIKAMREILRHGDAKERVHAIELIWTAMGRLPPKGGRLTLLNHNNVLDVQPFDREDTKAAMSLLRQERERQAAEREAAARSEQPILSPH